MNVLILAAGPSKAFQDAGYAYPKPLVEIAERPLLVHVLDNLEPLWRHQGRAIVLVREEDEVRHHLGATLRLAHPGVEVVRIRGETGGAACTALLAADRVDPSEPLVVTNGDQILDLDLPAAVDQFRARGCAAGTLVFPAIHPRWSYVRLDAEGWVVEASEKRPISRHATSGFYWFLTGSSFFLSTQRMILKDASVEGRFFICPVFNEMILSGQRVGVVPISGKAYHSLAQPGDVQAYQRHLVHPTP